MQLLHEAGAQPVRNTWVFFGGCAGMETFPILAANMAGVVRTARDTIVSQKLFDADAFDRVMADYRIWSQRPDAALWFSVAWAEGVKPVILSSRSDEGEAAVARTVKDPNRIRKGRGRERWRPRHGAQASRLRSVTFRAKQLASAYAVAARRAPRQPAGTPALRPRFPGCNQGPSTVLRRSALRVQRLRRLR